MNKLKDKLFKKKGKQQEEESSEQIQEPQEPPGPKPKTHLEQGEYFELQSSKDKQNEESYLQKGNKLWDRSGKYYACLDSSGRLCLYSWEDEVVWKTPKGGDFAVMKNDGNLVLYKGKVMRNIVDLSSHSVEWQTGTSDKKLGFLPRLQKGGKVADHAYKLTFEKGQLVIVSSEGNITWKTNNPEDRDDKAGGYHATMNHQGGNKNGQQGTQSHDQIDSQT